MSPLLPVLAFLVFSGLLLWLWRARRARPLPDGAGAPLMDSREWALHFYADPKMREVAGRFVGLLASQVDVPIGSITPQTRFLYDLEMVDLEPLELLLAIEQEFGTGRISEADASRFMAVDDVVQFLARES